MSYMITRMECNDCPRKFASAGGMVGSTLVQGTKQCPACGSTNIQRVGKGVSDEMQAVQSQNG